MSTTDLLEAIGKNDEAQKFKIEQPVFQSYEERDNHYFLKGYAKGAAKMKDELIETVKACHWYDQKLHDDCIAAMENVEVNDDTK